MPNAYGVVLDDASLRWAAAEGVSEAVIAVIKIVGRCPRCYPPGAYDALKAQRRPSPTPQPGERITPGPESSHRSAEQTKPATYTQRWVPPRRFAGFGPKAAPSASQRATVNPYGITLDRPWTEWAAKQGLSETVAAALYLISENRKTCEVMVKLTPSEIERVIDIVQRWPDCFPPRALAAIRRNRPAPLPEQLTACTSPDARHRSAARFKAWGNYTQTGLHGPVPPSTAPERSPIYTGNFCAGTASLLTRRPADRRQHRQAAGAAAEQAPEVSNKLLVEKLDARSSPHPAALVGRLHSEGYSRARRPTLRAEQSIPDPASAFAASSLILESGPLRARLSRFSI
jgi:hypothetical protein